jgi:hypothetical protein
MALNYNQMYSLRSNSLSFEGEGGFLCMDALMSRGHMDVRSDEGRNSKIEERSISPLIPTFSPQREKEFKREHLRVLCTVGYFS